MDECTEQFSADNFNLSMGCDLLLWHGGKAGTARSTASISARSTGRASSCREYEIPSLAVKRTPLTVFRLWQMALYPTMKGFLSWDEKRLGATLFGEDDDIAIYERHNEFVKRVVPKDRLLEFEAGMGFGPLCEFLGVAVPRDEDGLEIPYPHVNDTNQLNRGLNFLVYFGLVHWAALLGAVWWVNKSYGVLRW